MNTEFFQDIVKGQYGRKIAYTNVSEITDANILKVLSDTIGTFNINRIAVNYLWRYKNGDQPARYRTKTIRDDICNRVIENHAWEIVRFKVGQTYGEPMQFISLKDNDEVNKAVDALNDYMRASRKQKADVNCGEWQSAVGLGFKAIQRKQGEIPFRIVTPTPLNTYIVYSEETQEPLMAVQWLKNERNENYYRCFTDAFEYQVKNGRLLALDIINGETAVYKRLHGYSGIPIVEYPNNQDRLSDVELVIDLLDAINNMQSNRMDSIEQFVQSWVKFINCEIDDENFQKMKMNGALVVKSNNGSDNKADVDIMTQELNQTESQVAKDDLWDNALSILAIPNKQGNTGGDSQGAVELRNGWDFAKSAAKIKDIYVSDAEMQLSRLILNVIRVANGEQRLSLGIMDYDVQINHSPTDNLQVKAQSFKMLIESGIHPLIAIKTVGLWGDSEKVFMLSKPYLDVLYKTIEDVVEDSEEQERKAKELLGNKGINE